MKRVEYGRFFYICKGTSDFGYCPGKITFGTSNDGKFLDDDHNEDIEDELKELLENNFSEVNVGASESIHYIPNGKGNKEKLREILINNGWTEFKM